MHHWGESSSLHPYRIAFIHHISMMRYFRLHQPLQFAAYLLLLPAVAVHIVFELAYAWRRTRLRKKRAAAARRAEAQGPGATTPEVEASAAPSRD
jgi:hypothetical protein